MVGTVSWVDTFIVEELQLPYQVLENLVEDTTKALQKQFTLDHQHHLHQQHHSIAFTCFLQPSSSDKRDPHPGHHMYHLA